MVLMLQVYLISIPMRAYFFLQMMVRTELSYGKATAPPAAPISWLTSYQLQEVQTQRLHLLLSTAGYYLKQITRIFLRKPICIRYSAYLLLLYPLRWLILLSTLGRTMRI